MAGMTKQARLTESQRPPPRYVVQRASSTERQEPGSPRLGTTTSVKPLGNKPQDVRLRGNKIRPGGSLDVHWCAQLSSSVAETLIEVVSVSGVYCRLVKTVDCLLMFELRVASREIREKKKIKDKKRKRALLPRSITQTLRRRKTFLVLLLRCQPPKPPPESRDA